MVETFGRLGPHGAGSAILLDALHMPEVALFPTGWAAGFGAIQALVREADHIVLDDRAHACLRQGARAATRNICVTPHPDVEAIRERLLAIRAVDARNAILVMTEGLFSMDADQPNLASIQAHCRELGATLLVDVAHLFGAKGPGGLGALAAQGLVGHVDLVMGSFSKTFATNGGFLASHSRAVKEFVKAYSSPHTFSNALSPLQTAVARAALAIVRSPEGERLRQANARAAGALRVACIDRGLQVLGMVSPIVPVVVGTAPVARVASRLLAESSVLANLVEYPAIPVKSMRFRFQVMATHEAQSCTTAAARLADALAEARARWGNDECARRAPGSAVGGAGASAASPDRLPTGGPQVRLVQGGALQRGGLLRSGDPMQAKQSAQDDAVPVHAVLSVRRV